MSAFLHPSRKKICPRPHISDLLRPDSAFVASSPPTQQLGHRLCPFRHFLEAYVPSLRALSSRPSTTSHSLAATSSVPSPLPSPTFGEERRKRAVTWSSDVIIEGGGPGNGGGVRRQPGTYCVDPQAAGGRLAAGCRRRRDLHLPPAPRRPRLPHEPLISPRSRTDLHLVPPDEAPFPPTRRLACHQRACLRRP